MRKNYNAYYERKIRLCRRPTRKQLDCYYGTRLETDEAYRSIRRGEPRTLVLRSNSKIDAQKFTTRTLERAVKFEDPSG